MTATDPLTETAVGQLDRLVAVAENLRGGLADHHVHDPDPVAVARLIATAADAADRLALIAPEVFP